MFESALIKLEKLNTEREIVDVRQGYGCWFGS